MTGVKKSRTAFQWLMIAIKVLLLIELGWLLVVNGLLHLPMTQTVINAIRPDKFTVRWEQAWSWYPGRVWLADASASGSSRRQMWQVDVDSVSGSIALLPLLLKRVWISDVSGVNIEYRQRPRPSTERDYSREEPFFPDIEGRKVEPALPLVPKRWPWRVAIEDLRVSGHMVYWIYQIRGEAVGSALVDLEYRGGGGPLELDVRDTRLDLGPHWINGDRQVFPSGQASGRFGFAPFRPRDNRGWSMLEFMLADLVVDFELDSLQFINAFLLDLEGVGVDGRGRVNGRVNFAQGEILSGTELEVEAGRLSLDVHGHRIEGEGEVDVGTDTGGELNLVFRYGALQVVPPGVNEAMLTGDGLVFRVGGDAFILPRERPSSEQREISIAVRQLSVPNLALYQRYLPSKWPLALLGGEGTLAGTARMARNSYQADLSLVSDNAEMATGDYHFVTDLEAALNVSNPSIADGGSRLDGSYVHLSNARLKREGLEPPETWSARLDIGDANYHLLSRAYKSEHADALDLFEVLREENISGLLAESGGRVELEAEVSSLGWLAIFLGEAYRTRVEGSARVAGVAFLERGLPAPGTDVLLTSNLLGVNLLDYSAQGEGAIQLSVIADGGASDWHFAAKLWSAGMRRLADTDFFMRDVTMSLEALITDVSMQTRTPRNFSLDFRIPTARLDDMAVFNTHLPAESPLRFGGGEARLEAEILLQPQDATGWLRLVSENVELDGQGQSLRADLAADIALAGGVPTDMVFDLEGSEVRLDRVRVAGEKKAFDDAVWSASLLLTRGETVFRQPMQLELEARLVASDSRPLVALFQNQPGWRPNFLANAMTVEDIEGQGTLKLNDRRLVVPEAWLTSDNIQAGIKAMLEPGGNEGRVYLRYRDLGMLLKLRDGGRNIDIIRARSKYDAYRVPGQSSGQ
ncbi:MAG: hypothetical protein HKO85_07245 [Xanthomonadales bacterium]|nr:hypothetical protein [Xanthomonadales bacterium]